MPYAKPKTDHSKEPYERFDAEQQLTDRLIAKLEQGVDPWAKSWDDGGFGVPLRDNGEPFTGINRVALWLAKDAMGYTADYWLTFPQLVKLGGHLKDGEKASARAFRKDEWKIKEKNEAGEEEERIASRWKQYAVFNADQITGLPEHFYNPPAEPNMDERIDEAERFFGALADKLGPVRHGGSRAAYRPKDDIVMMPDWSRFKDAVAYYATLAHERHHQTGHPSRLDRLPKLAKFGSEPYAFEEQVADIGKFFTLTTLGLPPAAIERTLEETAAYCQSWLKPLRNDKTFIFKAAGLAMQSHGYMEDLAQGKVPPVKSFVQMEEERRAAKQQQGRAL